METLPTEVEKVAETQLTSQPFGGILKVSEYPELATLELYVDYIGDKWNASRRRSDQLDQVTFSRK